MAVETIEEAKSVITKWLNENGHQVRLVEDTNANFHFEIDYPLSSMKRQRVIQPKEYPGLIVLLNGVAIADEHKKKLKELNEDDREKFYASIRKDLIFAENSYDIGNDEDGIAQQVQFSYEFYLDSLNKTNLFKGLLMNHRVLMYFVTVFNDKFGIPEMPENKAPNPAH
ncbi:MAG: DUF2299 family protein [Deltaproteobacteria bacterium]|nr:DUF2299 family protein [Deltaproteobacteria bacterium]